MACGACNKAKARRKAALERRREAERRKQEEKLAKAAAAQVKLKTAVAKPVSEPDPAPSDDSANSVPEV